MNGSNIQTALTNNGLCDSSLTTGNPPDVRWKTMQALQDERLNDTGSSPHQTESQTADEFACLLSVI